jgi:hypothetical protein
MARHPLVRFSARLALLAAGICSTSVGAVAQSNSGLSTYRNDRHGFSLSYPTEQFVALPVATEDGRQFVSKDGKARLLAGTIANFDGKSLRDYRAFVLNESFPGAEVTYAPVRDTWFVISGIRNDMIFYQRVNFVCGGRAINSWAMLFPAAEKATYAPIVDQIHKAYSLGNGNCGQRLTSADQGTR